MRRTVAQIIAIILLASPGSANAQMPDTIRVEREKVLSTYGEVVSVSVPLYPVLKGTGRIFRQGMSRSGAAALRLHFKVENPTPTPTWSVQVLDRQGKKAWDYDSTSGAESDFWSDEVPGDNVTVEIFSREANSSLRVFVDRIAVSSEPIRKLAITHPDQRAPIRTQSPEMQAMGKAIARLRFISDDDGRQYYCTGFLVSPSLLLTNNHCIRTNGEMRSALVDFDFNRNGVLPNTRRFRELLLTNVELDFTLLRLDRGFTDSERRPLQWVTDLPLADNKALVVIQHPAGELQQVSILDCRMRNTRINGVTSNLTDFGHLCDTLGGSSGSPVIDISTGKVNGLHHLGFRPNSSRLINQAVHIKLIADFIRSSRPELTDELLVQ
jgi:V8-like Glu-specific endopeptidase